MGNELKDINREYFEGLSRAFGGAVIFALPILMTMEMWYLGFYMDRLRMALLMLVLLPLLMGLSYEVGFRPEADLLNNILDSFSAFGVGFAASFIFLLAFNVISFNMPLDEVIGKLALQTFSLSMGAVLSRGLLGGKKPRERTRSRLMHYLAELFIMAAGALFLSLNLAPTEEMILISFKTSEWHALVLMIISLFLMYIFTYSISFSGREEIPEGTDRKSIFLRFTVTGYIIVMLMSLYILWTFGRTDGMSAKQILMACVVLSFPGSIGAAAARLII